MDTEGTRMRICESLFPCSIRVSSLASMASPIPPSRGIGGRPKERERQAFSSPRHPLRQPRQLAERVEFPEKNAGFCHSRASFGGRGRTVQSCIHCSNLIHFGQSGQSHQESTRNDT